MGQVTGAELEAIIAREQERSRHRCLCTLSVWQAEDEYQQNASMYPPQNAAGGVAFCDCESCGPSMDRMKDDEPCDPAVSFCAENVCPCPFGEVETEMLRLALDLQAEREKSAQLLRAVSVSAEHLMRLTDIQRGREMARC